MHLTVSLLIECNGEITNGEYGRKVLCDYLKMLCQSHKPPPPPPEWPPPLLPEDTGL